MAYRKITFVLFIDKVTLSALPSGNQVTACKVSFVVFNQGIMI